MDRAWEREIAWAAGLFEGEGSFTLSRDNRFPHRPYRSCCAVISMCDREPIERFGAAVGMGRFYGPYQKKQKNHSPFWRWSIRGKDNVIALLALLEPYLTDRRVGRCIEVILADTSQRPHLPMHQQFPDRKPKTKPNPTCPHGHPYDAVNTYITPAGSHQCRMCKKLRERRRAAERRAALHPEHWF